MIVVRPGDRDTPVIFERPVADDSFRGAGSGAWAHFADEWVELVDQLPSRGEQPAGGMPVSVRRARLRMEWRGDIEPTMRVIVDGEPMQIITEPVTLGRRAGLEMIVEAYSQPGNAA